MYSATGHRVSFFRLWGQKPYRYSADMSCIGVPLRSPHGIGSVSVSVFILFHHPVVPFQGVFFPNEMARAYHQYTVFPATELVPLIRFATKADFGPVDFCCTSGQQKTYYYY